MSSHEYIILGGGMVAGYAAKEFVERGLKPGELAILSEDDAPPYERPPLSKGFLAGTETEEKIFINDGAFYKDHGIQIRLNTRVESLDLKNKKLRARGGEEYTFNKLLIATGAKVRTLDAPGANLERILYLRSLSDSRRIRAEMEQGRRALIIGSGFIGMEVASQCAQKGLQTTMVFPDDRIWKKFFTPEMSQFFQHYYEERGVTFASNAKVTAFSGDVQVQSATLNNGRRLPTDLVVAGVGVVPVLDIFKNVGLEINDGIVVNEYLETTQQNVYAAGDVANYRDVIFEKQRRVEHWDNAVAQGQQAARVLSGSREPFVHVPYFFSDVFDLSYEYWGDSSDSDAVVRRGNLDSASFSVWWLKQERLVAVFAMKRPDEERELAPQWIQEKQRLSAELLRDDSRPLRASLKSGSTG
jgi:NADPH-dependent 2,4-dienoyl-CoA reductase/sulfur reductase-like enzyme